MEKGVGRDLNGRSGKVHDMGVPRARMRAGRFGYSGLGLIGVIYEFKKLDDCTGAYFFCCCW
jgi:hypothetical protein